MPVFAIYRDMLSRCLGAPGDLRICDLDKPCVSPCDRILVSWVIASNIKPAPRHSASTCKAEAPRMYELDRDHVRRLPRLLGCSRQPPEPPSRRRHQVLAACASLSPVPGASVLSTGNQLFYVRVDDIDGELQGSGNPHELIIAADATHGVPCLLHMRQHIIGQWVAALPGFGYWMPRARHPLIKGP